VLTTALPKIAPLLLKPRTEAFDTPDWLFELKYDGFRALLEIDAAAPRVLYVSHIVSKGSWLFARAREIGCEGIISKRSRSPYRAGP
jgi:ATP-dependent DNA ligase